LQFLKNWGFVNFWFLYSSLRLATTLGTSRLGGWELERAGCAFALGLYHCARCDCCLQVPFDERCEFLTIDFVSRCYVFLNGLHRRPLTILQLFDSSLNHLCCWWMRRFRALSLCFGLRSLLRRWSTGGHAFRSCVIVCRILILHDTRICNVWRRSTNISFRSF